MRKHIEKLSKFISLVLRHKPDAAGITLDEHGWADVEALIDGICKTGRAIDRKMLDEIVRTDAKGRYCFNETKTKIRANQGHSIPVDVEMKPCEPPPFLYHGTAARFLGAIFSDGLKPMGRLYVHLSSELEIAWKVGARHGSPVVLRVNASLMAADGYAFFLSENGVWQVSDVPAAYLEQVFESEEGT